MRRDECDCETPLTDRYSLEPGLFSRRRRCHDGSPRQSHLCQGGQRFGVGGATLSGALRSVPPRLCPFPAHLKLQLLDLQLLVFQALDLEPFELTEGFLFSFFLFLMGDLEEEGIYRRRDNYGAGEVEQLLRREVDVPLVANAMRKVC